MTAADVMIESLLDWGVEVIFGLPGDGVNGIMESLRTHQEQIRFIQVRHEESAAFAACAYAKFTGRLGVCLATSGPGGIHLLNGLYDAKLDGAPVLAITGLQFHDLIGTYTQQDVALDKLFMDVAVYNERIMGPTHVENVTDLAVRAALSYRGVAHLTIPTDFQEMTVSGRTRSKRNVPHHTSDVVPNSLRLPQDVDLERAAAILNEGERIVILAGRGALKAGDELEQMAETLGAPIVKALLGKGCVPDDSPYTTQGIGLLGTSPSQDAMEECDTILIVGSSFPYLEYMPKPTKARGVQIDLDPKRIGLRFPVEVGLLGDSTATLKALTPFLERKEHRVFLQKAQKAMKTWNEIMLARSTRRDMPMKPQVPAHEVGIRLREDAITTCDSGTVTTWWARQVPAKRGQMHSLSGTLASMACALPYAIGAQVAFPERQVVSFVGDGGFSMLMADFVTAVKYKLPIKVVVFVNSSLGQIKWEQIVFLGNPEFAVDLASIDFAQFAQACGGQGFTVDDPKDCARSVEQFLAARGPAILQAIVDPNEPPLPGKATLDQALKFAEALARGEKDAGKILKNVWSDKVREMV